MKPNSVKKIILELSAKFAPIVVSWIVTIVIGVATIVSFCDNCGWYCNNRCGLHANMLIAKKIAPEVRSFPTYYLGLDNREAERIQLCKI